MRPHLPPWAAWFIAASVLMLTAAGAPAASAASDSSAEGAVPRDWPVLDSPVEPLRMVTGADIPARPWLAGHRGIDLAATTGQVVFSPGDGVVSFAGVVVDRPVVTVRLSDGRRSSVEPVTATIARGTPVGRGEPVGIVADVPGHCRPDVCVHWGVRDGETYLDPLDLLVGFGPVRLLRVW